MVTTCLKTALSAFLAHLFGFYMRIKTITATINTKYAVINLPNLVMLASISLSICMCVLLANIVTLMQN